MGKFKSKYDYKTMRDKLISCGEIVKVEFGSTNVGTPIVIVYTKEDRFFFTYERFNKVFDEA